MKHEIGIAPVRKGLVWAFGMAAFLTSLDFLDDETSNFEAVVYYPTAVACATIALYLTAYFIRSRPKYRSFSISREVLTVMIACVPATIVVVMLDLYVNPDLGQEIAEAPDEKTELIISSVIESYFSSILFLSVLWFFLSNAGRKGEVTQVSAAGERTSLAEAPPAEPSQALPADTETEIDTAIRPEVTEQVAASDTPLIARFPKLQGQKIRALEAQEHYVKVYTDKTEELVLYRFADAVRDVEDLSGLQVHRSFWVACEAVVSAKREGRKIKLVLHDGLEVPVSKTHRPAAEAAGLINF
ncbi:LytTR family DNA-binding domain-containing protein [Pelagibius sp. Alg239-R121]|uniref:LytTR family DNA-binding domain-containing protein n=1 Tax=Pelagibius sp. Alg239-R121 TaxID=2993448 RepID=UPI0024A61860|nr:LytTR family DNA-binding domain-containing protein [Pelagibius sp. Alg239-R121]